MSTLDWLVLLAGIAAIVWVNWYFFFAEPEPEAVDPNRDSSLEER